MKKLITFNQGIQQPANLGTLKLKLAGEGKMAYGQNIDVSNDEYGNSAVVPGQSLTTIGSNSELTGVPFIHALYVSVTNNDDHIYFAEGLLGVTNIIRRLKTVLAGSTPVVDTTGAITVTHTGHSGIRVDDMTLRVDTSNTPIIWVVGADATDTWVQNFTASDASPALSVTSILTTSSINFEHKILNASDGNVYISHRELIDKVNDSGVYSAGAIDISIGQGVTAMADWNQKMVIASNDTNPYTFAERKSAGQARVYVWDYTLPSFDRNIPAPCRYISVLIPAPSGNLLAFGGVDEGKVTVYEFTGYGFNRVFSYIGDLPRSRHSVDFDGQGRLMWITADGQICRYTFELGIFEHLGSITTASSAGGIFRRAIGGATGSEFIAASGSGSTYTLKRVTLNSYLGDGAAADDTILTPLAVSGIQTLTQGSNLTAITLNLAKNLVSGEKVELRIYANGSTSYTVYMTLDFSIDGAISSKREVLTLTDINNFSLGVAWKQADGASTAPPVVSAEYETETDK